MEKRALNERFNKLKRILPLFLALFILMSAVSMTSCDYIESIIPGESESEIPTLDIPSSALEAEEISVHIIDVGQGDAILIMTESGNMLIDSGDLGNTPRELLTSYLAKQNVTSFEYVVFTHTDADHIGSGDYVIENYDVKTVIMPDYEATTKVFARLVDAIEAKDVELILIGEDTEVCEQSGYEFVLGPITHTVMAPTENFKDANEMSVVIKSVYGETSMLFTGDAEKKSEAAMLEAYKSGELDCDILKVGHHGANTSTTEDFLKAVSPKDALISCGEGNKYGHPTSETLEKLEEFKVTVYRTDKDGSIIIKTDGDTYTITTEK